MPVTVSINSLTAVHAGSNGVSVAMPDVCNTPSPSGPIPMPYPNIAQSAQAMGTASDVTGDGQPLCNKDSYFMPSSGDEAGTAGGVLSGKIKGKAEFINFSFNVQIGGKPAVRALDPMLHNDKNTPPFPLMQPPLPAIPKPAGDATCAICDQPMESGGQSQKKEKKTKTVALTFKYATEGGDPVEDDAGFDLLHPDGTVETGKLAGGQFKKSGVAPGRYKLQPRVLRGARWRAKSAHPFQDVPFEVQAKNFPDGTKVHVAVRAHWHDADAAPLATFDLPIEDGVAQGTFKYEQKVGQPARLEVQFEATVGKKTAQSSSLRIVRHDLDENLGLQERLRALGYDPGPPAEALNDATGKAVEAFQKDHPPLKVDGQAGSLTLTEIEGLGQGGGGEDEDPSSTEVWAEVRVVTAGGKPLPGEAVSLLRGDGAIVDGVTDRDGVCRFENLPADPPEGASTGTGQGPVVFLPNVLEEWVLAPAEPAGKVGKNKGNRDDYRKRDGVTHALTGLKTRTELTLNALSDEQKLQHFIHAYTDNGAVYDTANPRDFKDKSHRWEWGKGSVCNQHVNFFLGYWFNYNEKFTTAGSATATVCLPVYDSDKHLFKGGIRHRGYAEFVEPVTGFGAAFGDSVYDPDDPDTIPSPDHYERAASHVEYIRMARYFDRDSGEPNAEGKRLLASLGPVNIYSLSDIKSNKRPDAEKAIRDWLRKHKTAKGLTDAQITAKTSTQLWNIVYDLDDAVDADAALIRTLKNFIVIDHHAGVLLLRAEGGGPSTGGAAQELWTFSADGATTPGPVIETKRFADADLGRRFLHLAIWKMKPLRAGGFAPADADGNAGAVNVENPPRFIKWG